MFRRESNQSAGQGDSDSSNPSSITLPKDRRSSSIAGTTSVYDVDSGGHAGQFPVTASHRRNTRKGSLLEISG